MNAWVPDDGGKKLLLPEKKAINIMEEHFAVVIGPICCLNFLRLGIVPIYYQVTSLLVTSLCPEVTVTHILKLLIGDGMFLTWGIFE